MTHIEVGIENSSLEQSVQAARTKLSGRLQKHCAFW